MKPIRILLADDHTVLRQGMAEVLDSQPDMEVVAQAKGGREAYLLTARHKPDVALLDINMPEMDGVAATEAITAEFPNTGVIILTMYKRDTYLFEAIKAGASGYLLKEVELEELLAAIRAVARGDAVIDPAITGRVMNEIRGRRKPAGPAREIGLAEKDLAILRYIVQGLTNQEIADRLSISEKTVRNRLSLVFKRFNLKNRTDAALFAIREGVVDDGEQAE